MVRSLMPPEDERPRVKGREEKNLARECFAWQKEGVR